MQNLVGIFLLKERSYIQYCEMSDSEEDFQSADEGEGEVTVTKTEPDVPKTHMEAGLPSKKAEVAQGKHDSPKFYT